MCVTVDYKYFFFISCERMGGGRKAKNWRIEQVFFQLSMIG
jgi:hypothetical protein